LVAAVVAEELGLEVADVSARIGSTHLGHGNVSGGSTTTACLAPALKDAAAKLKSELFDVAARALGVEAADLDFYAGGSVATRDGAKSLTWSELASQLGAAGLTTHGTWRKELQASGVHGAQAAKVAVDLVTGRVRVLEMIACHDAGFILNALAAKSQVQGAMVQALSYALFEERLIDPDLGTRLNPNFETYKLAGAMQIPTMKVFFDDDPRGVIGIGEPPAIPGAAAIANAVHNACGVRLRDLPLTPDKVLMGLEELRNA
jgi:xanthine dehydrogenase YagR molybdenum-binding subunit